MSNKTYDRLKWFALVFVPAANIFILAVGKIWGLPYYVEVAATLSAFGVFLGTLLGVSSMEYKKLKEAEHDDTGTGREEAEEEDS